MTFDINQIYKEHANTYIQFKYHHDMFLYYTENVIPSSERLSEMMEYFLLIEEYTCCAVIRKLQDNQNI